MAFLQSEFRYFGALLLVSIVLCLPLFLFGLPHGGDPGYQIISYEAFRDAIYNGDPYPKWLPDINKGLGGSNFFFIPPFVYYLAFFFEALSFGLFGSETALNICITCLLFLSGVSFYLLSRYHLPALQSSIFSVIYMCLPYHFWFEVFERTSITGFAAYVWAPLIFLCLQSRNIGTLKYSLILAVSYFFLIISHIPSAFILTVFIALYGMGQIVFMGGRTKKLRAFLMCCFAGILGSGLSALYLYPALTLLDHVNTSYLWSSDFDYKLWFITLFPHPDCSSPFAPKFLFITCSAILAVVLFHLIVCKRHLENDLRKHVTLIISLILFSFLIMTPPSQFIWDSVSALHVLQFPWRFIFPFEFLSLFFLVLVYSGPFTRSEAYRDVVQVSGLAFAFVTCAGAFAVYSTAHPASDETIRAYLESKRLTHEHIPLNENMIYNLNDLTFMKADIPQAYIQKGDGDIRHVRILPRRVDIDLAANEPTTVNIRQFYSKWWRAYDVNQTDVTDQINLRDGEPFGQMSFDLPKGDHHIQISMPPLQEERIGLMISLLALGVFLLSCLFSCIRKKPD